MLLNGTEKTLAELEQFSFSKSEEVMRPSIHAFAKLTIQTVRDADLRLIKSKWVVTEGKHLYGLLTVQTFGTEIDIKDSVLCIFCRYSNDSKYAPRFISCLRADISSFPFLVSLGHVAYRRNVTENSVITDAIEEGIVASWSEAGNYERILARARSIRLKKHEAFGLISQIFLENNFPITKSKVCLEYLESRYTHGKVQTLPLFEVLHSLEKAFKVLNIPDQYLMLGYGIPQMLTVAGIDLK